MNVEVIANTAPALLTKARIASNSAPSAASAQQQLQTLQIPSPRPRVFALMGGVAALIGGPIETLRSGPDLPPSGLLLRGANLFILGTACRSPLLLPEATMLQSTVGGSILVVRLADGLGASPQISIDFKSEPGERWLTGYKLWQQPGTVGLHAIPANGAGEIVVLSPSGPYSTWRSPFSDFDERETGLAFANKLLRRAWEVR